MTVAALFAVAGILGRSHPMWGTIARAATVSPLLVAVCLVLAVPVLMLVGAGVATPEPILAIIFAAALAAAVVALAERRGVLSAQSARLVSAGAFALTVATAAAGSLEIRHAVINVALGALPLAVGAALFIAARGAPRRP